MPYLITNIVFRIYSFNFPLGKGNIQFPSFLKNSKAVLYFEKDKKGKRNKDNLSIFRCYTRH